MIKTILIIEDDAKIADVIRIYLEKEGYRSVIANDGDSGLKLALQLKPDLIILDRMLPGMEGLDVLRNVRKEHNIPVLILSAKADEMEKIIGLEVGADDYLSKPFSPKELLARVKAILRRSSDRSPISEKLFVGELELDSEKMEVNHAGRLIPLSPLEFKILQCLAKHPGRVFSRKQLMEEAYDSSQNIVFDRTIDAHIKNLRRKLKDNPKKPRIIGSVFGVGYKLIEDAKS